ncbi:NAD-dependent epimerase/dehydratase family protein [Sphingomonas mesophila]|uniref:NAD-dependent epimerase/dehydratase family protein n=1 Tax=Sphingomonas mesophila TaxID=2303576 RepID=UPI000E58FF4D|nr:NAD-dependent epimerase/dehydratase family protein [Sphingomonas mesophila]
MKLAVTGGTGFVGGHLLSAAADAGHEVWALTRRPQPARSGVEWVPGSLDDAASLAALCDGAEAVIHVAGVINAPTAAEFEAGNVGGTKALLGAAATAGVRRFVHVSSLAAREPQLSLYGASKARSEVAVQTSPLDWAIVRPPAVYGPGDRETLELFKMARRGLVLLPPEGRLSLIHVADLARLLLALAAPGAPGGLLVEPDDGTAGGWTHRAFATQLGAAFGRNVTALSAPAGLLRAAARVDKLVRGRNAKLTPDRASYFAHPDWVASPARKVPAELWRAEIKTPEGLAETARWYEREGWL